jgi:hypothetical protein
MIEKVLNLPKGFLDDYPLPEYDVPAFLERAKKFVEKWL